MVDFSHWPILIATVNAWVAVAIGTYQAILWIAIWRLHSSIVRLEGSKLDRLNMEVPRG